MSERMRDKAETGPVTAAEAREALSRFVVSHWYQGKEPEGKERARFSIPADPKRDDDIRLSEYISQSEERIRELEAEVAALRSGVVRLTYDGPPTPKPAPANVLISEGSQRVVGRVAEAGKGGGA